MNETSSPPPGPSTPPLLKWAVVPPVLTLVAVTLLYDPQTTVFSALKLPLLSLGSLVSVLLFTAALRRAPDAVRRFDGISLGLVVFFLFSGLSLFWTPSLAAGVADLTLFWGVALCMGVFRQLASHSTPEPPEIDARGPRLGTPRWIPLWLAGAVTGTNLLLSGFAFWGPGPQSGENLLGSTIGNANHFAAFATASLPLSIWFVWAGAGRLASINSWWGGLPKAVRISIPVGLSGLLGFMTYKVVVFTQCRSAYVALAAGLASLFIVGKSPKRKRLLKLGIAALLLAVLIATAWRYGHNWTERIRGRTYLSRLTYRLWRQRPVLGHGIGSFGLRFPHVQAVHLQYNPKDRGYWTNAQKPHNEPLGLLAELGVFGLLSGVFFLLLLGVSALEVRGPPLGYRRAGVVCLVTLVVTGLAEPTFHIAPLCLLAGLVLGSLLPFHARSSALLAGWRARLALPQATLHTAVFALAALAAGGASYLHIRQYLAERTLAMARATRSAPRRLRLLEEAEGAAFQRGRIRFYLGLHHLEMERHDQALEALDGSLRDYANLGTHLARGNALMGLGKVEEAVEAYRHATWLNPRFAAAHYNLAVALERLGRRREARKSLLRAHRIWPAVWPRRWQTRRPSLHPPSTRPPSTRPPSTQPPSTRP